MTQNKGMKPKTMTNKACPKTLSGKHQWGEYPIAWKEVKDGLAPSKWLIKCAVCGMINDLADTKKGKGTLSLKTIAKIQKDRNKIFKV